MAITTNYGWTKPTVGGDSAVWGGELNTDLDGIDMTVKAVSDAATAAAATATSAAAAATAAAAAAAAAQSTASAAMPKSGGSFTGQVSFANNADFNLRGSGTAVIVQMTANGGINYDSATGRLMMVAGGVNVGYFDSTGYHQLV